MDSGVSLVLAEGFAAAADPGWTRPEGTATRSSWSSSSATTRRSTPSGRSSRRPGYHGRTAPAKTVGPYAAMVDDPDGNVVLISSDAAADPAAAAS